MSDVRRAELDLPEEVFSQLMSYLKILLQENQRMNLTAIRDEEEAYQKHIRESVLVARALPNVKTLLDVGSGGGLPGLVIAIVRPEIQVTLLESIAKKARFLDETAQALQLSHVRVLSERAEEASAIGQPERDSFDCVTARAVAAMPTLVEITAPFCKTGGTLLYIKGERALEEVAASKRAFSELKVEVQKTDRQETATLVWLKKLSNTPNRYPRRVGEPKRKPL